MLAPVVLCRLCRIVERCDLLDLDSVVDLDGGVRVTDAVARGLAFEKRKTERTSRMSFRLDDHKNFPRARLVPPEALRSPVTLARCYIFLPPKV